MTPDGLLSDSDIRALGARAWLVLDGVLGPAAAGAVHEAIEAMAAGGRLRPSRVGRGAAERLDRGTRGDAIAWLEPDGAGPAFLPLLAWFAALRDALNRGAYLGLRAVELQVARYPGAGAAYRRHRDAFPAPPGGWPNRRVTAIYYANPGWRPADGGHLRLYAAAGPVEVEPLLDRAVVFLSEAIEHEVLPTAVPRRAVTAWFRAGDPLA